MPPENGHLRTHRVPDLELLQGGNLLGAIRQDIGHMGLVGEASSGLLAYLSMASRKLNQPLSVVVRGVSSSGKNAVVRAPAKLIPPDQIMNATSMTTNVLYRLKDKLKNKVLIGGERKRVNDDAQADATGPLRQLISEGYISKLICVRKGNDWVDTQLEAEGPVAYLETTTVDSIFDEDLNRMVQIWTDESADQTRNVLRSVARIYTPNAKEIDQQAIIRRHHEFQDALEFQDVRIPYAEALAEIIPSHNLQWRRAFWQVMSCIEALAMLHQFERELTEEGYLQATWGDYEQARRLLVGPLKHSVGLGKSREKDLKLLKMLSAEFTTSEAKKVGKFENDMSVKRTLERLQGLNLVELVEKGKSHRPAKWRKTNLDEDDIVLPSRRRIQAFLTS